LISRAKSRRNYVKEDIVQLNAYVRDRNHVCCRYRLQAFQPLLAEAGHHLEIHTWPTTFRGWLRIPKADAIVIQRKLLARWQLYLLRRATPHLIFDFDDAIFLRDSYAAKGPHCRRRMRRFAATMRTVDAVTAGNSYLAEQALECTTNALVDVIPTCVDTSRYFPRKAGAASQITLVWIGSSSTVRGLEIIRPALEELGRRIPGLRLKVIADRFPDFANLEVVRCPWSEATEAAEIATSDIGISWLPDDLWSRGKCGLKILQYLAAGLPVVTNDVGVHSDMVRENGILGSTPSEFVDGIARLAADGELRERMGRAGRRLVEDRYSIQAGARSWVDMLERICTNQAKVDGKWGSETHAR